MKAMESKKIIYSISPPPSFELSSKDATVKSTTEESFRDKEASAGNSKCGDVLAVESFFVNALVRVD